MKRIAIGLSLIAVVALGWSGSRRTPSLRSNPIGTVALPLAAPVRVRGAVRERIATGSYVYLRIVDERGDERWFVTLRGRDDETVERCVEAMAYARAERFESSRLARRFEPLLFGAARRCR